MMVRSILSFFTLLSLLTFISCNQEEEEGFSIFQEEVIYLSGERVRLLGRMVAGQNLDIEEHGFYLDRDERFSNPIIVNLGPKNTPGRFIGEYAALEAGTEYHSKAYMIFRGNLYFSESTTFSTLTHQAFDFHPRYGKPGQIIEITGQNLSADTQVFFGDTEAEVQEIILESKMKVKIPPFGGTLQLPLSVVSQGRTVTLSTPFDYVSGRYERVGQFLNGELLTENIHFQQEGRFFVGLGLVNGHQMNSLIWSYDPATQQWENTRFPGSPSWGSFGATGFFGAGATAMTFAPYPMSRDLWQFQNGQYLRLGDMPFTELNAVGFRLEGQLFVIGGTLGIGREIYRYDPQQGTWTLEGHTPFPINQNVVNFGHQQKQYFINPETLEIYSFDAISKRWEKVGDFPVQFNNNRGGALGVVLDGKAYVGLHHRSQRLWEWDIAQNQWKEKNDFPGLVSALNVGVFTDGDLIYLLRSPDIRLETPMELWTFDPYGF